MGGAVCSGRKWLTEGRWQDRLLLVGGVVALGNISPPCGPVVAWHLPLLSQGNDGIGLERTHVGTRPTARRGVWVHGESALGGVNGNRGL